MVYGKVVKLLAAVLDMYEEDIAPELELNPPAAGERILLAKLVIACEKQFKITIHDEDVPGLTTVGELVKYIEHSLEDNKGLSRESTDAERLWWYYD